jgi:hypothetical protein
MCGTCPQWEIEMAAATARIPVLVTIQAKARIAKLAKESGLSMGEFLRRAAESFRPDDETEILNSMIDQMIKTTNRASEAIDDALEFIDASNKRMAALESAGKED